MPENLPSLKGNPKCRGGAHGFRSPLIEKTNEFGLIYAGSEYLDNKRVKSIAIDATTARMLWDVEFELELFTLDYDENPNYIGLHEYSQPFTGDGFQSLTKVDKCEASIDSINGTSPAPASFKTGFLLDVKGWLIKSTKKGELPDETFLVIKDEKGKVFFIDTKPAYRPDVGTHFNNRQFDLSGFVAEADISRFKGVYTLGLAYSKNGSLNLCPEFNITTMIGKK